MWLNVSFISEDGSIVSEINPYTPLSITTDPDGFPIYQSGGDLSVTEDRLVYEANMSSSLTGEQKTFHVVLATERYKDNRIPPRGILIDQAAARLIQPRWHGNPARDYFTPKRILWRLRRDHHQQAGRHRRMEGKSLLPDDLQTLHRVSTR